MLLPFAPSGQNTSWHPEHSTQAGALYINQEHYLVSISGHHQTFQCLFHFNNPFDSLEFWHNQRQQAVYFSQVLDIPFQVVQIHFKRHLCSRIQTINRTLCAQTGFKSSKKRRFHKSIAWHALHVGREKRKKKSIYLIRSNDVWAMYVSVRIGWFFLYVLLSLIRQISQVAPYIIVAKCTFKIHKDHPSEEATELESSRNYHKGDISVLCFTEA